MWKWYHPWNAFSLPSLWEISLCCNKMVCLSTIYVITKNFTQTIAMTAESLLKVIKSHIVETKLPQLWKVLSVYVREVHITDFWQEPSPMHDQHYRAMRVTSVSAGFSVSSGDLWGPPSFQTSWSWHSGSGPQPHLRSAADSEECLHSWNHRSALSKRLMHHC